MRRRRTCLASVMLALIAGLSIAIPVSADEPQADRDIALWVIRKGGRVLIDGASEYTSDPFDLPQQGVRVVGVDMHGAVVPPIELEPLGKLADLREVLLPARVWSPSFDRKSPFADEMFDYFKNSTKLEKFEAGLTTLAYLRLGEPGLERLARLKQLRDVRVCLVTIKSPNTLAPLVNMEYLDLNDANV